MSNNNNNNNNNHNTHSHTHIKKKSQFDQFLPIVIPRLIESAVSTKGEEHVHAADNGNKKKKKKTQKKRTNEKKKQFKRALVNAKTVVIREQ